uniref:Uncharacterized protein LOC114349346 n=1 Tax=Diabrotica virgifera virgifera TaxID=50390 RepID=A0A6P7H1T7_DIAVI
MKGEMETMEENDMETKSENKRLPWTMWLCLITAHLLNITTGISIVWPTTIIRYLVDDNELNPVPEPIGNSSIVKMMLTFAVSPLFSYFLMAKISDRVGRKISMRCLGALYIVTFLATAFSKYNLYVYYIAFFISGCALAGMFINVSIYTSEIADDKCRAWIGCLFGLMIPLGIIFGSSFDSTAPNLQIYCLICTLPAILHVVLSFFIVESPSFLVGKQKRDEAISAIIKLRNYTSIRDAEKEYENIWNFNSSCHTEQKSLLALFRDRTSKKSIMLGFLLLIAQHFTGIDLIVYYSVPIFFETRVPYSEYAFGIITNVVSVVAMLLATSTVSRYGQRLLLVCSSCICTLMLFCLSIFYMVSPMSSDSWLAAFFVILFFVGYGIGLAPIPLVLVGNLFRNETRAVALSIVVTVQCLLEIVMNSVFSIVSQHYLHCIVLFVYAIASTICLILIYRYVPETRGKSFQEIQDILSKSNKQ